MRSQIPDYPMAAWLMAVYWRGMLPRETCDLPEGVLGSVQVRDLSRLPHYNDPKRLDAALPLLITALTPDSAPPTPTALLFKTLA